MKLGKHTWRALNYIKNSYTVNQVSTPEQAKQVAISFAHFTKALKDLDASKLSVVIPNFHNITSRLAQLTESKQNNIDGRLKQAEKWQKFCYEQKPFISQVEEMTQQLPLRVIHNDTKINNLLFCNDSQQPLAVIDLDTCMPGHLMYDFGDMVRTCCSSIAEDATNLGEMSIDFEIYQALISNYQATLGDSINELEKQSLKIGARLLPLMVGIRFLTDFLNGDVYFNTSYSNHNLDRAANQLTMYQLLSDDLNNLDPRI